MATSVLGGMLFSGAVILPTAVMNSAYRDALLNSKLKKSGLQATTQSGSGSWITPLTFQNVELADEAGHIQLTVESIEISQSLLGLMMSNDLGKVTVIQPNLRVALDENGDLPLDLPDAEELQVAKEQTKEWDLEFEIQNAAFELSVPWRKLPIVAVTDVDIEGDVSTSEEGRWLTIQPVQVFEHEPLSEAHSEQNLALIAPVLSQSTALEGEVSVRFEGNRIRLDQEKISPFPIRGTAIFHSVNTRLRKEWAIQVSQLMKRAIGTSVPNRLEIARDSAVAFQVDEVGIHHQGLGFLLPDISTGMQIQSSGTVGLDESIDLALALQMPQLIPRNPFTAALSNMVSSPFQLQVKGTVSEPKLITPPGFSMVDQLSLNADPTNFSPEPKSVNGALMDIIRGVASPNRAQATQDLPSNILEMIRAAQEAKRNAPPKEKRPRRKRPRKRDQVPFEQQ